MGKSSRRNRPSKAQRKKNAIVARNNNFYNIMNCKSTNKASRGITGGPGRDVAEAARLTNQFKKKMAIGERHTEAAARSFKTTFLKWSPLI